MNEEKIREIFDLCLRVSSETTAHVNFDYTACDDISRVYIFVFNDSSISYSLLFENSSYFLE